MSRMTVSITTIRVVTIALVITTGLLGQSLVASTAVVGPSTCKPAYTHYPNIQTAVSSVPFNTIVMVCPGFYPEQVIISQPLTLEGVTDGTGNAAVITVPAGGLVQNATSNGFGPVTVQLLAQNTVGVIIKDLIVDGNGANCPAGSNRNVGIGVFDVGTPNDGTTAALRHRDDRRRRVGDPGESRANCRLVHDDRSFVWGQKGRLAAQRKPVLLIDVLGGCRERTLVRAMSDAVYEPPRVTRRTS